MSEALLQGLSSERWEHGRVEDFGEVRMGRQRSPKHETGLSITPYLRVANVLNSHIDYSDVLSMNFSPAEKGIYGLKPGDILLNEGQSLELVGRSAIYKGAPGEYCYQNTLIRYRCADSLIPEFAQMLFSFWLKRGYFSRVALQTTSIAHLGADRFARMEMSVPPLAEQRKIADVLEAVDVAIDSSTKVIAKLEQVSVGLARDSLSQVSSEHSWVRRRLGDFASVRRGASPRPISDPRWFAKEGPGWVRISDVTASGKYLRQTTQYMSPLGASRSVSVRPGQVVMSIAATVGESIIVDMDARIHDGFVLIEQDPSTMSSEFLLLSLKFMKTWFASQGQTGTQANINSGIVRDVILGTPPLPEQELVVRSLSSAEKGIAAERARLEKLRKLKAGLMDDLLTGRVRVDQLQDLPV